MEKAFATTAITALLHYCSYPAWHRLTTLPTKELRKQIGTNKNKKS
jgi:hypothetical protein